MHPIKTELPSKWIPNLAINIIVMIIAFLILRNEVRKRKQLKTAFTTIWFKLFSITCIVSFFVNQMAQILKYAPGFCIFCNYFTKVSNVVLYVSMGLYQLYRLYYCFANNQVHSNKGYPKSIFIFMGTSGVICAMYICITMLFVDVHIITIFNSECGYNDKYEFYSYRIQLFGHRTIIPWYYYSVYIFSFTIWDLLTLCLYMMKIRKFKGLRHVTEQPIIYKRIMSILLKIFILTIFYEVLFLLYCISFALEIHNSQWLIFIILRELSGLSVCCSMYLMMDHNEKEYLEFLKIIYVFRFHWICFCWRHFVIEEICSLDRDIQQSSNAKDKNKDYNPSHQSEFKTSDPSVDDQKIDMPELSVATRTVH